MVATYHSPPCLASLAACAVAKCLTYEDYDECTHYRWDPVIIWQYELPQRKKKGKRSSERSHLYTVNDIQVPLPQPPWKELKKFRDWWWHTRLLGGLDSSLRRHIVDAVEQLSWTSNTEEEYVLFLLLRLCLDTRIELCGDFEIPSEWCADLAQVISQLGPYPLQRLSVYHDSMGIKPVLTSLVHQAPYLQVLKVNQWAVSNDLMAALGSHCDLLTEFAIPSMQPQVFMNDEALFACFFSGASRDEVVRCWREGVAPQLSFKHLKYLDVLYCRQTEKFIQMMCYFYPGVRLLDLNTHALEDDKVSLAQTFADVGAKITALRMSCRTKSILNQKLENVVRNSVYLRELRIHIDDNFEGADCDSIFERRLEEAGAKLKKLVSQVKCFDSLALRPHEGVNVTKVMLPTLHAQGHLITSLRMCYEYCPLNTNVLYMIVNLCPKLCRLAVSLRLHEADNASLSFRTNLSPCTNLHTLVIQDISSEDEEPQHDSGYVKVARDVLKAAPNLEVVGLSCAVGMDEEFAQLFSASVRTMHLEFCLDVGGLSGLQFFLHGFLPNFPGVRVLSLEIRDGYFQFESIASVCRTGVRVTRRTSEFFQIPKWESSSSAQNTFALLVM